MNWESFIKRLGPSVEKPLDKNDLKSIVKLPKSEFPDFKLLNTYFHQQFKTQTLVLTRTKWHWLDKALLIWCLVKQAESYDRSLLNLNEEDFNAVAQALSIKVYRLKQKWMILLKTTVREMPWLVQENELLLTLKQANKKYSSWNDLAIDFNERNPSSNTRYTKQIREHWNNVLNPSILRSKWTIAESVILLKHVQTGCKSWSNFRTNLAGRTDNQIKNKFNALIKFAKRKYNKSNSPQIFDEETFELTLIENLLQEFMQPKIENEDNIQKKIKLDIVKENIPQKRTQPVSNPQEITENYYQGQSHEDNKQQFQVKAFMENKQFDQSQLLFYPFALPYQIQQSLYHTLNTSFYPPNLYQFYPNNQLMQPFQGQNFF